VSGDSTTDLATATVEAKKQGPSPDHELLLLVESGPDEGKIFDIGFRVFVVGTSTDCHCILTDKSVSRRHLELRVSPHGVIVKDLKSRNGSFYQGARITEVLVGEGTSLGVGLTRLRLVSKRSLGVTGNADDVGRFGALVGRSRVMHELFARLRLVSPTNVTVLINGETGTGKELCAKAIHDNSPRRKAALTVCDLAGLPPTLVESELFGHTKGAFTGATADRVGAFESADGGTIFLDEIGELPLDLQPRLLRALEDRSVRRVGASSYRKIDVRIVAATNRDLAEEVEQGRFRRDLYHRLVVVPVRLPPSTATMLVVTKSQPSAFA
jgi:transcriptional regulator of acetoin/glycerol metabolism